MNKVMASTFAVALAIGCIASYLFGVKLTRDAYSTELLATQAMLSFNHLQRYEELSECIRKQSIDAAGEKARLSAIGERDLLSDLLNTIDVQWLNEYIELRTDDSLVSFKEFESPLKQGWSEPQC